LVCFLQLIDTMNIGWAHYLDPHIPQAIFLLYLLIDHRGGASLIPLEIYPRWNEDGNVLIVDIQVNLPDGHIVVRTYTASLVSLWYTWGDHYFTVFVLENIFIDGKLLTKPIGKGYFGPLELMKLRVGNNPRDAFGVLYSTIVKKAAASFACTTFRTLSEQRLKYQDLVSEWSYGSYCIHGERTPECVRVNPVIYHMEDLEWMSILSFEE
jgi:hypothetical protein